MGIIIRQSIKSSIVTYVGVIIGMVNVLFLYNKFLSTEQLGLYAALTSFPLVFAAFINLGTPHIAIRFFPYFENIEKKHNGFFGYLIIAPLLGFFIFIIFYFILRSTFESIYNANSPLLVNYFAIFPAITFCLLYQSVLEAYSRVHLRIVVPTIIREIFLKLSNSILAIMFGFHWLSFSQLVYGIVLVNALSVLFSLFYVKFLGKLFFKFDFSFINKPIFKEMWQYGLWIMIGGALATVIPHLEKLLLPAYNGGLSHTAIFAIALSIGSVIGIPRNAIASISEPLLAQSWKTNDLAHVNEIYQKSALNLLIVGLFLFLGIWCNIDAIFNIVPNSNIYKQGKFVVLMVGFYYVFDMATGLNSEILKNSPYFRFDFAFHIVRFVVLLGANLYLIPIHGYNGAAVAMLLSSIVYNGIKYFYIKSKMGFQPFNMQNLKVIFIGLVIFGLTLILHKILPNITVVQSIVSIVCISLFIAMSYLSAIYYFKISTDINNLVNGFVKKSN